MLKAETVTVTLAQCRALFEDHFKEEMPGKMPYEAGAKKVFNEIGKAEFLRRLSYLTDTGEWIKDDPGRRAKRTAK